MQVFFQGKTKQKWIAPLLPRSQNNGSQMIFLALLKWQQVKLLEQVSTNWVWLISKLD